MELFVSLRWPFFGFSVGIGLVALRYFRRIFSIDPKDKKGFIPSPSVYVIWIALVAISLALSISGIIMLAMIKKGG